jgi:hypothetical protein
VQGTIREEFKETFSEKEIDHAKFKEKHSKQFNE